MRVLLVDADPEFTKELARELGAQGIEAVIADQGRSALRCYFEVDAVLLDLTLPDIDGFQVCQQIRACSSVPIIILSCRGGEFDHVLALTVGADDYVVKPYRLRELVARIEAAVRRAQGVWSPRAAREVRRLGPLHIDCYLRQVTVDNHEVALTPKEFDLLVLLTSEPGRTFSRGKIMGDVWGYEETSDTRTLGVHMVSLRRKLGHSVRIETVRGIGFRSVA
jgi:two-component system response regulator RegX3